MMQMETREKIGLFWLELQHNDWSLCFKVLSDKTRSIRNQSRGSDPEGNPTMMCKLVVFLALVATSWAAEITCPEIGTFNNSPPFDQLPLPWCMNLVNPHYTMYTRSNPKEGQTFDAHSVPAAFSASRRTVFLVHGYVNSGSMFWLADMKDAFLGREDINVVIVDWAGGAILINYFQAASNTRSVGTYTALVIDNLVSSGGGAYSSMWCVGHSLGSHVCGHTGMKTTLGRITGMDPAGPAFSDSSDLTIGLNPSCANFVDIIHTNTVYGTLRTLGHIDFYPASGTNQPGCLLDIDPCGHFRAFEYMTQSVIKDCFQSRSRCNSSSDIPGSCSSSTCGSLPAAYMGYAADKGCQQTGIFYLAVSLFQPYCVG